MGLDMYLFREKKTNVNKIIRNIRKAIIADEAQGVSFGEMGFLIRGENLTNHVDELGPEISWIKMYELHEWFSKNVLHNKSGSEEKQIGYVTLKHLRDLLSWCDNRTKSLCLLTPDDAFLLAELKRTKTEVTALINSTDFNKMVILYFAYW